MEAGAAPFTLGLSASLSESVAKSQRKGSSTGSSGGGGKPKLVAVPDGRCCRLCQESDDSADPTAPSEFRAWGYPVKPPLAGSDAPPTNQGLICFYCLRVYNARFSIQYPTVKALVEALGKSEELLQQFRSYLAECVRQMCERGTRDVHVDWPSVEKLKVKNKRQLLWESPTDEYWSLDEYRRDFGDPATNGKGHQTTQQQMDDGTWETFVVIPGRRIFKAKRQRVQSAELSQTVDSGTFTLGANQVKDKWAQLAQTFEGGLVKATGMSLDAILAQRAPAASPQTSAPPAAVAIAPPAPCRSAAEAGRNVKCLGL